MALHLVEETPYLEFTVLGKAEPAGALAIGKTKQGKSFLHHRDSAGLKEWRYQLRRSAQEAMGEPRLPLRDVAIAVQGTFAVERPAGHYGTGRNAGVVKPTAPRFPIRRSKGDIDKLTRAVLDAFTGLVFADDSQVVKIDLSKIYADYRPVGAEFRLWVLA